MSSLSLRVRSGLPAMLAAQFADGFGGRFHGVLLALYALQLGGLEGFAGFAAAAMVGSAVSAVVAGWLTSRIGGSGAMRISAAALLVTRIATYLLIPFGLPLSGLICLRLIGSVAGTLVNTGAKAHVPDDDRAGSRLAWMNVSNGGGQAVAALAGGVLSTASGWTIAVVGAPIALAATWPMVRLAARSTGRPVAWSEQLAGLRVAAGPITLGALVFTVLNALPVLADGLIVEQYAAQWLGPLTVVAFLGSLVAAGALRWLHRTRLGAAPDALLWTGLGALGVAVWALGDEGITGFAAARFVSAFVAQVLASLAEVRVMERAGRTRALPALSASGAIAALGGAATTGVVPWLLAGSGYTGTVLWSLAALAVVAVGAVLTTRTVSRVRHRTATPATFPA